MNVRRLLASGVALSVLATLFFKPAIARAQDGPLISTDAVFDAELTNSDARWDILVNGGNAYTTTLVIPLQPLNTNFPAFLVATDPSTTNSLTLPNSGAAVDYTLGDAEGTHELFFRYVDDLGHRRGPLIIKTVTVDRLPPYVAILSPANNAVVDQAFITLQAVAADPDPIEPTVWRPLKIWINDKPCWDRAGTNITIERFPVPSGANSFTVTIRAVDEAGNTNTATRTWPVDLSRDTTAPRLSSFNITTPMLLPDVSQLWLEGAVDDSSALVNAIVSSGSGDVTTNALHVRDLQFEGLVPLEFGTNQLVLLAFDAAGNTTSNAFTIIRSDRYRFEITSPAFGEFATTPSTYVSGYVSALFDEGLPTQTNITRVFINGVAAVLSTNIDANGNRSFTTTNAIPLGVPITGHIAGPGIPTNPLPS